MPHLFPYIALEGGWGIILIGALFTLIHDPINGKPDIIVLYQAHDNAYMLRLAHMQDASWNISDYACE